MDTTSAATLLLRGFGEWVYNFFVPLPPTDWSMGQSCSLAGCGNGLDNGATGDYWLHSLFNNCYTSPSIRLVRRVWSCLFVLTIPSCRLPLVSFSFFFSFPTCSLRLLKHISDLCTWAPEAYLPSEAAFHLPLQPCLFFIPLFNLFLFRSPSSSFHLAIVTSAGTICGKRFNKS